MNDDILLNETNDGKKDINLNINISVEQDDLTRKFIKELTETLEEYNNSLNDDLKLTEAEEMLFYKQKEIFLQEFFKKELDNTEKGQIFLVTDKYENDTELHRYKVTQYKNNAEYKYVTFEKDLPENIKINDVVRKINEKYIYDEEATQFIKEELIKIKNDIINNRK